MITSQHLTSLNALIRYQELNKAHLKAEHIGLLIKELASRKGISHQIIGDSYENRPIHQLSIGHGETVVLAWTQMHGDEATATASVLDLLDILSTTSNAFLPEKWQSKITLHVVPMLNPDGAERITRQNAQSIDINRDALRLQTPEGRVLMQLVQDLQPTIAFNLHDQSPYYQCGNHKQASTIAFLAPAFDQAKTINAPRALAMQLISQMYFTLNADIAHKIARYDDTFSARSFGDQIAKLGASTILIESGAHPDDPNRQIARALNTKAMLTAINLVVRDDPSLAPLADGQPEQNSAQQQGIDTYFAIPENTSDGLCSLLIKNLSFDREGYQADVSIKQTSRYSNQYIIDQVGDLHVLAGLQNFDASGMHYANGKPFLLNASLTLDTPTYLKLLSQGFSHFVGEQSLLTNHSEFDVLLNPRYFHNQHALALNCPAYGLLTQHEQITHALLNGKIVSL